jgi:quercetin dioxygenase-like cupin family protein
MAYKNKIIRNPITGQSIRFLQTAKETGGRLLEMETTYEARSSEPVAHYHPHQQEEFRVLQGEVTVKIDGKLKVLKAGDKLHVDRNVVHSMWNQSDSKAVMNWKVSPALDTEYFFENTMGLATDGKTNARGLPRLLQVVVFARRFSHVFRLAKPSYPVQRILFTLLAPLAYLKGLKPMYQKYLD